MHSKAALKHAKVLEKSLECSYPLRKMLNSTSYFTYNIMSDTKKQQRALDLKLENYANLHIYRFVLIISQGYSVFGFFNLSGGKYT